MRMVLAMTLTLLLGACAEGEQTPGGVANYDALKRATDACVAKGGTLTLKKEGDSQYLEDYACERK
jgi:hypothetical protein